MPEDLLYQGAAAEPAVEQVASYREQLNDPATHPGLRPHLLRLANGDAGPGTLDAPVATGYEDVQAPVKPQPVLVRPFGRERLEEGHSGEKLSDVPALSEITADMHQWSTDIFEGSPADYGASLFEPDERGYARLASGEYSEHELVEYIREARVLCDAYNNFAKRKGETAEGSRYEGVLAALTSVPLEKMRSVYFAAEQAEDVRFMLEQTRDVQEVQDAFWFVRRMYGKRDVLELWDQSSPALDDPTFQELVNKDASMEALASTLETRTTSWPEGMEPAQEDRVKRAWGRQFLDRVVGLPEDHRKELLFDSHRRVSNQDTHLLDTETFTDMLVNMAYNVRALGLERVKQLHDEAGITSIDYYADKPLQLLCAVLDGNPKAIEHLQDGDTTVVFTNATEDYNGAFSEVNENYRTANNRTLFFEIKQPGDIYRYMSMLNKRGVKPSTLVMAAHGEEGLLSVNDGNGGFQVITNKGKPRLIDRLPGRRKTNPAQKASYEISTAEGFGRLVRDYMQDSRGIDDNLETKGRRRIIMDNCLSASPVKVRRPGLINGVRRMAGTGRKESLAKTVIKTVGQPNLDVFGNKNAFQKSSTKDGSGVEHFLDVYKEDGTFVKTVDLKPTKYSLSRRGRVVSRRIRSIPLRRVPDKQLEEELQAA